jgi:hypothetical protein
MAQEINRRSPPRPPTHPQATHRPPTQLIHSILRHPPTQPPAALDTRGGAGRRRSSTLRPRWSSAAGSARGSRATARLGDGGAAILHAPWLPFTGCCHSARSLAAIHRVLPFRTLPVCHPQGAAIPHAPWLPSTGCCHSARSLAAILRVLPFCTLPGCHPQGAAIPHAPWLPSTGCCHSALSLAAIHRDLLCKAARGEAE